MRLHETYSLVVLVLIVALTAGCPPESGGWDGADDRDGTGTASSGDTTGTDVLDGVDADGGATGGADGGSTGGEDGAADVAPEDDGTDEADADSLTFREAFRSIFSLVGEAICSAAYDCPQKVSSGLRAVVSRFGSASACADKFFEASSSSAEEQLKRVQSDIEDGRTTFDEQKARECIRELESRVQSGECRNLRIATAFPESCRKMLKGTQSQGENCAQDRHCASYRCDTSAKPNECYGECVSPASYVGQGETCDGDAELCRLSDGLICTTTSGGSERSCRELGSLSMGESCPEALMCGQGLNCVDGTCQKVTVKAQGESCSGDAERCEVGFVCAFSVSGSGSNETVTTSCEPPHGVGDPCYIEPTCASGHYCKGGSLSPSSSSDSTEGTCERKLADGESCNADDACQSGSCNQGTCEATTTSTCTLP